jgi:hypothetical protein
MIRQRVRISRDAFTVAGLLVLAVLALALIWGGAVVLALAAGAAPGDVAAASGYRDAWAAVRDVRPDDLAGRWWLVAAGALAAVLLGRLAFAQLPRPRLARHDLALGAPGAGLDVAPRAIEHVVEHAAREVDGVRSARALLGDADVVIGLGVTQRAVPAAVLADAHARATAALVRHGLPPLVVHALITHTDRNDKRSLR